MNAREARRRAAEIARESAEAANRAESSFGSKLRHTRDPEAPGSADPLDAIFSDAPDRGPQPTAGENGAPPTEHTMAAPGPMEAARSLGLPRSPATIESESPARPAMNVHSLGNLRVSLFKQQVGPSQFGIHAVEITVEDDDKLLIHVGLRNTDTGAGHAAIVKVALKNAAGEVLCEGHQRTGSVGADGLASLSFEFSQPGLLGDYQQHMVTIHQTA